MKHLQIAVFVVLVVVSSAFAVAAQSVTPADLKLLEGGEWVGELTYLDYGSNRKTSIKSNLIVAATADARTWQFEYIYPKEPKANGKIRRETFCRRPGVQRPNCDRKNQACRQHAFSSLRRKKAPTTTRKLSSNTPIFSGRQNSPSKKKLKVEGGDAFFERNTYSWTR